MLKLNHVKVNNKVIYGNKVINPLIDKVSVLKRDSKKLIVKNPTRVWIFNKPAHFSNEENHSEGKPSVMKYIENKTHYQIKENLISVAKLDHLMEGVTILTNDDQFAEFIELPEHNFEVRYKVRVRGTMTEQKMQHIRRGALVKGQQCGPFYCKIDNYKKNHLNHLDPRHTWFDIRMNKVQNKEIENVMKKNKLIVNKLIRESYGPYDIKGL